MEIGVVRGASKEEVLSKKFNLYVGVSLGNNWFNHENLRESINWCLKNTKSKVAVLIADALHVYNYEVRNKMNFQSAFKRAKKEGFKMRKIVEKIILEFPKEIQSKVEIVMWEDVKKDSFNKNFIDFFNKEFNKNKKFQNEISKIVKNAVSKENRNFNEQEINKLCNYVLEELPELLHGFKYKDIYYNAYVYPYDSLLTQFVEKIQKKLIFTHFFNELDIKKNVFIELNHHNNF